MRKVRRHNKKKISGLSGQGDISYLTEEVLRIFEGLVDFINTLHCREIVCEQAGAELCQAQFKLGLAKTAFPDVNIVFVFVFPLLKV